MSDLIKRFGFIENFTFQYIFNSLTNYFGRKDFISILEWIKDNKFKERFLINLENIISSINSYQLKIEEVFILKNLLIYSPFLTGIIKKNPDYFLNYLFKNKRFEKVIDIDTFYRELKDFIRNVPEDDIKKFKKYLRYFKQREFLRIGLQDLNKIYSFEKISQQLSHFAIAVCRITGEWLFNFLKRKYNLPLNKDKQIVTYTIIGMGKLGAEELNYSSDIDLIYFISEELENNSFYRDFFELFTQSLNDITEDGFVFRVDLRLRPDGSNGPLFLSFKNALFYYENWGKTWERGALLKATPVAGDIKKGEEFLKELEPFIYRKSIDFQVINDIREIKKKINLETKNNEYNLKLGKGGIREIEFIMQAIQLMYGGKDKSLREKNLLKFFKILKKRDIKILNEREIDFLIEAYIFLRNVEHKIQIYQEKQTQSLPVQKEQQELLAYIMGFSNYSEFLSKLNGIRENVYKIFDDFFKFSDEAEQVKEFDLDEIIYHLEDNNFKELESRLKRYEFKEPKKVINILNSIRFPAKRILNQSEIYQLNFLIHNLLKIIKNFNNKDEILIRFYDLYEKIKFRTGYIEYLNENLEVLENIIFVFSQSEYLSQILIKYREIFEELYISNFILQDKNINDYPEELDDFLKKGTTYEDYMELIRIFKHKETIRIGIKFLTNNYNLFETITHLTALADAILLKSIEIVKRKVTEKFGPINSEFTIIALGKYGGEELNFASDLDLILVYEKDTHSSNGFSSIEYFSKFLQRLISFLSINTANGKAYDIDTRLRPSGNAGALVCSFDSFKEYHEKNHQIWEIQALMRSRTITGDKKVEEWIKRFILKHNINNEDIDEMMRIRKRIETEEGRETDKIINIKSGKGGIIDVEFLTQILLLQNKFVERNTFNGLKILFENNVLSSQEYETLYNSYYYLREVENLLRLKKNVHTDTIKIANFPEFEKVVEVKEKVRKIFKERFSGYFEKHYKTN